MPGEIRAMPEEQIPDLFSLILLGTDTLIEEDGTKLLEGYERGETLNAIFRCLKGEAYKDKHIVSGPVTSGSDTDEKAAEGIWMALKAISEGKTTIKIAGHSRGGVEGMLVVHALEKIIALLKETDLTKENLEKKLKAIELGYVGIKVKSLPSINISAGEIKFDSKQGIADPVTKAPQGKPDKKTHSINIERLLEQVRNHDISCELFLIDPVPGNEKLSNWVMKEFFEIPKISKKTKLFYMSDERTNYFEPIVPKYNPENCQVEIYSIPGHHGTASGWLNEQGVYNSVLISDDAPKKGATEPVPAAVRKGKNTRHVQKLMTAKMVEYFGVQAFNKPNQGEDERSEGKPIPPVTKTINRRLLRAEELNKYKLNVFKKIIKHRDEYKKFQQTNYSSMLGSKPDRTILVSHQGTIYASFSGHAALHDPSLHIPYVNEEHILLTRENAVETPLPQLLEGFIAVFEKRDIEKLNKLYASEETLNKYNDLYFYGATVRFLGSRIQALVNGNGGVAAAKKDVGEIVTAVNKLQKAINTYETEAGKKTPLKTKVGQKLDQTWKRIIDELGITPRIDQISEECLALLTKVLSEGFKDETSLQTLDDLNKRLNGMISGLDAMKEILLIDESKYQSYKQKCDAIQKVMTVLNSRRAQDIQNQSKDVELREREQKIQGKESTLASERIGLSLNAQIQEERDKLLIEKETQLVSMASTLRAKEMSVKFAEEKAQTDSRRLQELELTLTECNRELNQQNSNISVEEQNLLKRRKQLELGESLLKTRQKELDQQETDLQKSAQENNRLVESTQNEKIRLERERTILESKKTALEQEAVGIAKREKELSENKRNNEELDLKLNSQKRALATTDAELNQRMKTLTEKETDLASRETAVSRSKQQSDQQAASLKTREDEITKQLTALSNLQTEKTQLEAQAATLKERENALNDIVTALKSRHPRIVQLDEQLICLNKQNSTTDDVTAKKVKAQLMFSLKNLRDALSRDIEKQIKSGKKKIDVSTAGMIAGYTMEMVKELLDPNTKDRVAVIQKYEANCKKTSGWSKFFKVIRAVCFAAIGFIVGAAIGAGIGFAAGALTGPGAFVTAAIGIVLGAAAGVGMTTGIGSGIVLFKPKGVRLQAINIAQSSKMALKGC